MAGDRPHEGLDRRSADPSLVSLGLQVDRIEPQTILPDDAVPRFADAASRIVERAAAAHLDQEPNHEPFEEDRILFLDGREDLIREIRPKGGMSLRKGILRCQLTIGRCSGIVSNLLGKVPLPRPALLRPSSE